MLLLSVLTACNSVPEPIVAGPMTVRQAKALHDPPAVVVETEKINPFRRLPPHPISIPIYALGVVQLETSVTIKKDGKIWWNGMYAPGGRLRLATKRDGDGWLSVAVPNLPALDRRLAVATHAAPDIGDKPGYWERFPTVPRVVSAYAEALEEAKRPRQRGDLIRESVVMFPEAGVVSLEWLAKSGGRLNGMQ